MMTLNDIRLNMENDNNISLYVYWDIKYKELYDIYNKEKIFNILYDIFKYHKNDKSFLILKKCIDEDFNRFLKLYKIKGKKIIKK